MAAFALVPIALNQKDAAADRPKVAEAEAKNWIESAIQLNNT